MSVSYEAQTNKDTTLSIAGEPSIPLKEGTKVHVSNEENGNAVVWVYEKNCSGTLPLEDIDPG